MEELNKNQIVLLTLLISFVTSIATGIMTNALLQEAPIEVTRNINRIVEKTIETVTPAVPSTTQKEVTTVVVKEEDQIIDSINKNVKSIVRISTKETITGEVSLYGIGLVYNKEGFIVADKKTISSLYKYIATMSDGTDFVLTPTGVDKQTNFIVFKPVIPESTDPKAPAYVFSPASFSDVDLKLGQTLVGLGGVSSNSIAVGRVTTLDFKTSGTGTSTVKTISNIDTDLSTKDLLSGSPAFNLSGDIVGIKLSNDGLRSFTPVSVLKREITLLTEPPKSAQ